MQFVQRLIGFVKATVIGGVFVLAPVVLLVFVIGQTFALVYKTIHPLLQWLPWRTVGGISSVVVAAVGLMIAACFLAGLVAHTAIAKWLVRSIESAILGHLPGYTLVKSMGEGMAGLPGNDRRKAVLVHFEDRSQFGFLMDAATDGRLIVFVPNVPSPWSGSLHVLDARRVEPLDAPIRHVVDKLQRLGEGLGTNLPSGARPA